LISPSADLVPLPDQVTAFTSAIVSVYPITQLMRTINLLIAGIIFLILSQRSGCILRLCATAPGTVPAGFWHRPAQRFLNP
jgi:hypothetical protein